jgi:hypothetical protein
MTELDWDVAEFLRAGTKGNAAVLSAVFKLNVEIGKLLRPTGDAWLRDLQLKVNDVTVAAKRLDTRDLAAAMRRLRAAESGLHPEG